MKSAVLLLALLLTACGGSGGEDEADDRDAAVGPPAVPVACSGSATCESHAFARVCRSGACAECVSEVDCARPGALGPQCSPDRGYCVCGSDADCAGNPNGGTCHASLRACTCIRDSDCPPDRPCSLLPYLGTGVRTCQATP